ncbi:MAG: ATPase [Planctomycetaceae bacterium]|nr:ATPase [Planctomycetaceae bacterium]
MYESYWHLKQNPFDGFPDAEFFFESETHQAALLKLRYLIENRKGAGLLVGGGGYGKSFLLHVLAQQLTEQDGPLIPILFPQMSPSELLAYIAAELGAKTDAEQEPLSVDRTIRQIQDVLVKFAERKRHPVIAIEEAHLIDNPQVFQALRLLLNFQPQHGGAFTLILSGQRDLLSRIRRLPQLEERLTVKCLLRPLSYEETLGYVTHRLHAAGLNESPFEPSAFDTLFELSGGIPRRINRLCDLALLVGFADGTTAISASQLEAVSEELTAVVPD